MTMHLHMDSMGSFLVWLGRASWQASVLILLVLLAQWHSKFIIRILNRRFILRVQGT